MTMISVALQITRLENQYRKYRAYQS